MEPYAKHLFICQGNDCYQKGSEEIREEFRRILIEKNLYNHTVRVNKSGCFDQCKHGINVVIYPEGVWYSNVDKPAVKKIVEKHLIGGELVANLLHHQMTSEIESPSEKR